MTATTHEPVVPNRLTSPLNPESQRADMSEENSECYFLKDVANSEKTQTNKGTDSGTLRRPLQDSLQSE